MQVYGKPISRKKPESIILGVRERNTLESLNNLTGVMIIGLKTGLLMSREILLKSVYSLLLMMLQEKLRKRCLPLMKVLLRYLPSGGDTYKYWENQERSIWINFR